MLQICDQHRWHLNEITSDLPTETPASNDTQVGVTMTLSGSGILAAPGILAQIGGITALRQLDEPPE